MKKILFDPTRLHVISDSCIEAGNDMYLTIAKRPEHVVMIFLYRAGADTARHITTLKMEDPSAEAVRKLFCEDPYYQEKLLSVDPKAFHE